MKRISKKLSRREMLKLSAMASTSSAWANPFLTLMTTFMASRAREAMATSPSKNYFLFLMHGGLVNWPWSCFLKPNNDPNEFVVNRSVSNVMRSGGTGSYVGYTGNSQDTTYENGAAYQYLRNGLQKTIYLPKLWDIELPLWNGSAAVLGGGFRMRDMLNNVMLMRGVNMGVDIGHIRGPMLVAHPLESAPSLTGLVADANGAKIPAVGLSSYSQPWLGYASHLQTPIAVTRNMNAPFQDLLSPFLTTASADQPVRNHATNRSRMAQLIDNAVDTFATQHSAMRPGVSKMFETYHNALLLFDQAVADFTDLAGDFSSTVNKYQQVILQSRAAWPGVLPPPAAVAAMTDAFSTEFAVAEYFLLNNLTSSFTFDGSNYLSLGAILAQNGSTVSDTGYFIDEHTEEDRQKAIVVTSFFYRSFMACLKCFIDAIGPARWQNSVVQIASEYGRRPRDSGGLGSDHAPSAQSYFIASGALTNFIPIGNIRKDPRIATPNTLNIGTWGDAASTVIGGGTPKIITNAMAGNTVADLLGVERPVSNSPSLIRQLNGQWVSDCEDPRNKEE